MGLQGVSGRVAFDFWPCPRPMTRTWGSGQVFDRISSKFGRPTVAFGNTDGIPEDVPFYDRKNGHEWSNLPLEDNSVAFGYWDPPYDRLYKREAKEIWRCCLRLVILHTYVYPTSWFCGATREGMVAVTMGPLKQIRCVQVFRKSAQMELSL